MSRSNSCMVYTYLIELVAGIMTGYIFIYLDDAIVMRFALSILYIPAVLVLVDAKSKMGRFLVYLMLTAVCFWGVLYYIVVAIPSAVRCNFFEGYRKKNNVSYYKLYCEAWANYNGQKYSKMKMKLK